MKKKIVLITLLMLALTLTISFGAELSVEDLSIAANLF